MVKTIGVVGSGTMGSGIAQTCAQRGYCVVVQDIARAQLERCKKSIEAALQKRVDKGKLDAADRDAALARLSYAADMEELAGCEVVIEAVMEQVELKKDIFARLERVVSPRALLATNTSSLPLIDIAQGLSDPSRLVGIHFFNPVPAMKLVEIVKSVAAREELIEEAAEFARSLGKEVIFSKDTPGFIVNYLQYPFRLNAIRMLERGMATREEIDMAAKYALGHPMGPLELQDMVGLDITYNAVCAVYDETKDPAMAPPVLLKRMVQAGHLGRKTGKGFYEYQKEDQA